MKLVNNILSALTFVAAMATKIKPSKKTVLIITANMLAVLIVFYYFFVVIIPPHATSKINKTLVGQQQTTFIENKTDKSVLSINFHVGKLDYTTGKTYSLSGAYSFAPLRKEKVLKNNLKFTVLFPFKNIDKSKEASLNNAINAHVFIALQRAAAVINDDFYDNSRKKSYPELLTKYLNDLPAPIANLYFTDVSIPKILYADNEDVTDKDIQKLTISCSTYLTVSQTLNNYTATQQLASLNTEFQKKLNLNNN